MTKCRLESLLNYPISLECEGGYRILYPSKRFRSSRVSEERPRITHLTVMDDVECIIGKFPSPNDVELPERNEDTLLVIPLWCVRCPAIWERDDVLFPANVWCFRSSGTGDQYPSYLALEATDATERRLNGE